MTKATRFCGKIIASAAVACAVNVTARAEIVYDNSDPASYKQTWHNAGVEFGDEITLSGTSRVMSDFQLEYFLSSNVNGNETALVRFYANDGANGAPGSLLYDSGAFSLTPSSAAANGLYHVSISGMNVVVPNTVTWTVLFGGVDPIEQVGVVVYDPPKVGSSFNDYWARSAQGDWALNTLGSSTIANFGAQVTAIPEPGTVALAVVGGLMWVGVAARRRQRA